MTQLGDFYRTKKILLTGNTGFKGTWMNLLLEQMNASVWGYSLPLGNSYVPDLFYRQTQPCVSGSTYGDIADAELVTRCIRGFEPDIIFHLASHSSLSHSMDMPHHILETNMMGVLNVLDAARTVPSVRAIIIVTSDKVYRNLDTDISYKEDSPLGGTDPYSTSKICQELLTQCYANTFFENKIRVATARASNTIGPGDYNLTRLFPYLVEEFKMDRVPAIRNPKAIRPWQSVMDVITGYLLLGKYLYEMENLQWENNNFAFNFGPLAESFVTVEEMAVLVSREFENKGFTRKDSGDHIRHEARILKLDSSKATDELGWKPVDTLSDCIHRSIQFVKKEQAGADIMQLAREFVTEYLREWGNRG